MLKLNHNTPRDAHLFDPGPKRLLALDGGGVLGVIEIAFLEEIQALLRRRTNNDELVLADYFDLIGGTSTGAIIATALAVGYTAAQVKSLYFDWGPAIFSRPLSRPIPGMGPRFNAGALASRLRSALGERQLQSEDLRTGLAIIAKRIDTGAPWVLTNNPRAKYWNDPPPDPATGKIPYVGNKRYKLRDLLRASSAAPYYFSPKRMTIVEGEPDGLFVDGAVSNHNSPALQLLMLASLKGYGFSWPLGSERLMIISIGTGWIRPRITLNAWKNMLPALLGVEALMSVSWDAQVSNLKLLQWLSGPRRPWIINSEVGSLEGELMGGAQQRMLHFARYDIALESSWLKQHLDVDLTEDAARALNRFTDPAVMEPTYALARRAAKLQVDNADFPSTFDLPQPVSDAELEVAI